MRRAIWARHRPRPRAGNAAPWWGWVVCPSLPISSASDAPSCAAITAPVWLRSCSRRSGRPAACLAVSSRHVTRASVAFSDRSVPVRAPDGCLDPALVCPGGRRHQRALSTAMGAQRLMASTRSPPSRSWQQSLLGVARGRHEEGVSAPHRRPGAPRRRCPTCVSGPGSWRAPIFPGCWPRPRLCSLKSREGGLSLR